MPHLPVSSARFETVLTPDRRSRQFLLLCSCLATFAGLAIILSLPLPPIPRVLLCGAWLGDNFRQFRGLRRGAGRVQHYSLEALDDIVGISPDGLRQPMALLEGSIVLPRLAWLRLRFADGSSYVELLRGDSSADLDWQRLQLIWRLRRTVVGDQEGS